MHEGLIILSKQTLSKPSEFLYCNRPAQKLIDTYLKKTNVFWTYDKKRDKQRRIMTNRAF